MLVEELKESTNGGRELFMDSNIAQKEFLKVTSRQPITVHELTSQGLVNIARPCDVYVHVEH